MKKFALILLISIYSLATMGFSLKEFYCCGKLKSISLFFSRDANQECKKESGSLCGSGCCENKYQFFKVKDQHISGKKITSIVDYFTWLHLYPPSFSVPPLAVQTTTVANSNHAPPLFTGIPVYLYNCVFRI